MHASSAAHATLQVRRTRAVQRAGRLRAGKPVCAVVGYTNAGKSSLVSALSGKDVGVEDRHARSCPLVMHAAWRMPRGLGRCRCPATSGTSERLCMLGNQHPESVSLAASRLPVRAQASTHGMHALPALPSMMRAWPCACGAPSVPHVLEPGRAYPAVLACAQAVRDARPHAAAGAASERARGYPVRHCRLHLEPAHAAHQGVPGTPPSPALCLCQGASAHDSCTVLYATSGAVLIHTAQVLLCTSRPGRPCSACRGHEDDASHIAASLNNPRLHAQATLEEVVEADLLLHVMDGASAQMQQQREAVLGVLRQIGVPESRLRSRMIEVINKADLLGAAAEAAAAGEGVHASASVPCVKSSAAAAPACSTRTASPSSSSSSMARHAACATGGNGWCGMPEAEGEASAASRVVTSALSGLGLDELLVEIDAKVGRTAPAVPAAC